MPSQRQIERDLRVNDIAVRILGNLSRGMSYDRAVRRVMRDDPTITHRGNILRDAIDRAGQIRAYEGRRQATETRRRNIIERERERLQTIETARGQAREPTVLYEREGTASLGVPNSRAFVHFVDPVTGQMRDIAVYLPLPAGLSREAQASRVAAAIVQALGQAPQRGSDRRIKSYYEAIVSAGIFVEPGG